MSATIKIEHKDEIAAIVKQLRNEISYEVADNDVARRISLRGSALRNNIDIEFSKDRKSVKSLLIPASNRLLQLVTYGSRTTEEMKREIEAHMKEYHDIAPEGISFGDIAKNNLLATSKVFRGVLTKYVTCTSGENRLATIDVNP